MKLVIIIPIICLLHITNAAKILILFHIPAPSHYILGSSLARALVEKGHDVTMISPFGEKDPPKTGGKYRDIILTGIKEKMEENFKSESLFSMSESSPFLSVFFLTQMTRELCEASIAHPNVQKLINSNEKFDVVIIEKFANEAHHALAHHFGASLIVFSTVRANNWVNPSVGNPAPWSYVPDIMLSYSGDMTFCQRLKNVFFNIYQQLFNYFWAHPGQKQLVEKYFPNAPDFEELLYNVSLVLANSHPSISQPIPLVPAIIDIGSFHVKPPKALPEDLQKFLDGSKQGAIYFSLGSNVKSAEMPIEKRNAFINAFSKLKLNVLWKFEDDSLKDLPKNVKLGKWLPQQDILAHPNIKLFITHGGFLSTTETLYHGVPVLAIPIMGDQKMNAANAVNHGYGLMLPFKDLNEENLLACLNEILTNEKYRKNAKARSTALHDQETKPLDKAIFWVEYVIRHKGAKHLRVAALNLQWYQYLLLDVLTFVAFILASIFLTIKFIMNKLKRKPTQLKSNKKKN